ncbi:MAG: hypothetical protein H6855_00895 [Rhodospirillales bacterium]|nr:hypothetical protein [Rhodospirillales bacterium]MCB9964626.1 hypothetical protein [Rhodospirillales bacterium]MCB9979916.1 hypothetical protein [Rhodospirillales bacterium]
MSRNISQCAEYAKEVWEKKHPGAYVVVGEFVSVTSEQVEGITRGVLDKALNNGALETLMIPVQDQNSCMALAAFPADHGDAALGMCEEVRRHPAGRGSEILKFQKPWLRTVFDDVVWQYIDPVGWAQEYKPSIETSLWDYSSELRAVEALKRDHPGEHIVLVKFSKALAGEMLGNEIYGKANDLGATDVYLVPGKGNYNVLAATFRPEDGDLALGMANEGYRQDNIALGSKRWKIPESFASRMFNSAVRCVRPEFRQDHTRITGSDRWDQYSPPEVIPEL